MKFSLPQLEAFVLSAENGTFQAAAIKLNKRAQAVAKLVSAMEDTCNVRLFERKTRRLEITEEGKKLLVMAKRVLFDTENLNAILDSFEQKLPNSITLAIDNMLICPELTSCIKKLRSTYPTMDIKVLTGTTSQVTDWVINDEVSIGLRASTGKGHQDLVTSIAFSFKLCELAPSGMFPAGAIVDKSDVAHQTQIVPDFIYELKLEEMHVFSDQVIICNDLNATLSMVQSGLGWTIAPDITTRELIQQGKVVEFSMEGVNKYTWMAEVIYKGEESLSVAEDDFVQYVTELGY